MRCTYMRCRVTFRSIFGPIYTKDLLLCNAQLLILDKTRSRMSRGAYLPRRHGVLGREAKKEGKQPPLPSIPYPNMGAP